DDDDEYQCFEMRTLNKLNIKLSVNFNKLNRTNLLISSSLFGSGANKQDSHLMANNFVCT
ncbi:hypothetical protein DERF_007750, partial [Dermatophagoides farinae]